MTQNSNNAAPKVQQPKVQQPQFKIDSKPQQQRSFRNPLPSTQKGGIQQRNNIPLKLSAPPKPADVNLFKASMVENTPSVVSKTLLENKNINNVLIETYQYKYSDNSYLNKTYLDGFLISSVDPVGGTRVTYQTNIQAATDFINRQNNIRYQPMSSFENNLNYNPYNIGEQLQQYEQNLNYGEPNLNPNYQNRFLSNLIV
jgi:hypothetical protein